MKTTDYLKERINYFEEHFNNQLKMLKEDLEQVQLSNLFKIGDWVIVTKDGVNACDHTSRKLPFNGVYANPGWYMTPFKIGSDVLDTYHNNSVIDFRCHQLEDSDKNQVGAVYLKGLRLATKEEIYIHLKQEAIKRGFKDGCTHVWKSIGSPKRKTIFPLHYSAINDNLADAGGFIIYDKTGWAEIIEETKELPKTVEELEDILVCCMSWVSNDINFAVRGDVKQYLKSRGY